MRATLLVIACAAACGSGSSGDGSTSGPIESIVHTSLDGVRLYAVRHKVDLATLPARRVLGLPVLGTGELDARASLLFDTSGVDLRNARGKVAVRCVGACQLGDDQTRLRLPGPAALGAGDVEFSHLDLTGLDAEVTIADGVARLTRWSLASVDLDLQVDLTVTLGRSPARSTVDACVRFRPTDALRERDPRLHALLGLSGAAEGPDGRSHLRVTGALTAPRIRGAVCGPASP